MYVKAKTVEYLFSDVGRVQRVVQGCFSSFIRFPRLHQVHSDPHIYAYNLRIYTQDSKGDIVNKKTVLMCSLKYDHTNWYNQIQMF